MIQSNKTTNLFRLHRYKQNYFIAYDIIFEKNTTVQRNDSNLFKIYKHNLKKVTICIQTK